MGGIDNEYVTRIIHYFLEGTDRKCEVKRSHTGPSRYFNRVPLECKYGYQNDSNASAGSEWTVIDKQKNCLPSDRTRWQVERNVDVSHRNGAM
jgi:hypothetical protein